MLRLTHKALAATAGAAVFDDAAAEFAGEELAVVAELAARREAAVRASVFAARGTAGEQHEQAQAE